MVQIGSSTFRWYSFRTKRHIYNKANYDTSNPLSVDVLIRGITEDTTISGVKSFVNSRGKFLIMDLLLPEGSDKRLKSLALIAESYELLVRDPTSQTFNQTSGIKSVSLIEKNCMLSTKEHLMPTACAAYVWPCTLIDDVAF
jgi:hypothetical protein